MRNKTTYISEIINALENLEGMATLNEINDYIERRDVLTSIHENRNWKASVRATIQRNCSQTKSYLGKVDLFYSVYGLGEGVWGLKSYETINFHSEITPHESRQVKSVLKDVKLDETEKETIVLARKGQGEFRKKILDRFGKCIITGIENPNLLIASHIKPWRSSDNYERLSPENGIMLSPLYDKLFDLGYITFDNNTKLYISKELAERDRNIINFDIGKKFIPNCSNEMKQNFEYHNDAIFRG